MAMFWTCRYHQPFVTRLVQDCNHGFLAGKPKTCRPPSLTKSRKQPSTPSSSFFRSSHTLSAGMKFSFCFYRRCHKTWFHVFDEVFGSRSHTSLSQLSTRNLSSSSPSWNNNSLFQYHDNSRTNNSADIPLLAQTPNSLPTRPAQCPPSPHEAVSSSSTSLTFASLLLNNNSRIIRPFTIDAKCYGTQANNSPNQGATSTPISVDSEQPNTSQHLPLAKDVKEDIHTIPNLLTCCRMASAPLLSYLILNGYFSGACVLLVCAGITDLLDGYIARNFKNQNSMLGTALDPLADKILISFLTVSLTVVDLLPLPLLLVIIGRDLGLIGICFYIRYVSLPPPKTLKRYFDVTHATAELSPTLLSKVNTAVQLSLLGLSVAAPVFGFVNHVVLQSLWYLTASTTILSGVDYIRDRQNVWKILGGNPDQKESKQ